MTKEQLDKEIFDLTAKLNKALNDLGEQGDRFIDKKYLDKVFELNKKLTDKIEQKNRLI